MLVYVVLELAPSVLPSLHGPAQADDDAVRPADPFEFVGLLATEDRLASRRNEELQALATLLRDDDALRAAVAPLAHRDLARDALLAALPAVRLALKTSPAALLRAQAT